MHLQLQLALLDYRKLSGTREGDDRTGAKEQSFTLKRAQYGLASRLAFGLGYGASEHFELLLTTAISGRSDAARFEFGDQGSERSQTRVRSIEILPSARYVGGEGSVRPYLGATMGFEGSKLRGKGVDVATSYQAFRMSADAGIYFFVHEHLSLEPGLELGFMHGSVDLAQGGDDGVLERRGTGLRFLFTLGLSAWLGESGAASDASGEQPPAPTYAQAEPNAESTLPRLMSARIEQFTLELAGDPRAGTELYLLLTKREDEHSTCPIVLSSDEAARPMEVTWYLNGADAEGPLVTGSGRVGVSELEGWLAHHPVLSICGENHPLTPELHAQFTGAIARFRSEGTTEPAAPAPSP